MPFQNREIEIETIARKCLENLKISGSRETERTQAKYTLFTTAQIWGSGKSWLGAHFLDQFKSPQYSLLRNKLEKEFGKDSVNTLLNTVYIIIDFRDFSSSSTNRDLQLFVTKVFIS